MGLFKNLKSKLSKPAKGIAPIIESPSDRGVDRDYRRPGDPPHIIRINQARPEGMVRKWHEYIGVAGISMAERSKAAEEFIQGTRRKIELERDPMNEKDPNAIRVIAVWFDENGTENKKQVGWIPSDIARELAPYWPLGATLEAMFAPHEGKSPGIRISIWGPNPDADNEPDQHKRVQALKKEGRLAEAERLLLTMVEETERESGKKGYGVAPWPYEQLAIIYRKQKDTQKEIEILERFAAQKHSPGATPQKLVERLEKLRF